MNERQELKKQKKIGGKTVREIWIGLLTISVEECMLMEPHFNYYFSEM
ncbi:hypothetical protein [Bacillus bingmayongensis]|nr:hypothetical protein [Bacillus bingmayongensis]